FLVATTKMSAATTLPKLQMVTAMRWHYTKFIKPHLFFVMAFFVALPKIFKPINFTYTTRLIICIKICIFAHVLGAFLFQIAEAIAEDYFLIIYPHKVNNLIILKLDIKFIAFIYDRRDYGYGGVLYTNKKEIRSVATLLIVLIIQMHSDGFINYMMGQNSHFEEDIQPIDMHAEDDDIYTLDDMLAEDDTTLECLGKLAKGAIEMIWHAFFGTAGSNNDINSNMFAPLA
ncbi:hypothetical protein ACJX0J_036128, partial [Zea mays]